MSLNDPSNTLFQLAVKFVNQTGKHLFLTGKAGTGKTTFLRYIRENSFKKMAIVAPTGVAAINAGGVTMHSFFQLPFGPFVPAQRAGWDQQQTATDQHSLFKNIRFNAEKRQLLTELEMVVIDEVSMLRADMLDAIDLILRHFRNQPLVPFGGVQMIFIGDLFQLPPVINNEEWEILKAYYKSPFFFDALSIQQSPPLYLELKKIYRQSETGFINLLNNIRNNQVTAADMEKLHSYYRPDFHPPATDNYIILTSHNAKAEAINRQELAKLPGRTQVFNGTITGDFSEKVLPADINLQLKTGAQVIFLKNDKGENRKYYNGKIGQISRMTDKSVFVSFADEQSDLEIEKETWKNIRYRFHQEKNKIEEEELGTFTQYPIRLAWAITIHKSQGLTFEKAIIDAGASFAAGQVYVALSRLTTLEGLALYSRIYPESIRTDERVVAFTQTEKEETILHSLLQEEQLRFMERLLIQFFDWIKPVLALENLTDGYEDRMIQDKEQALQWSRDLLRTSLNHQQVALKFQKQLEQLLFAEAEERDHLLVNARIAAATGYFKDGLETMSAEINAHIKKYAPKQRVKKYIRTLEELLSVLSLKNKELKHAVQLSEAFMNGTESDIIFENLNAPTGSLSEKPEAKSPVKEKKLSTKRISLDMFREGKTINEIAESRDLVVGTIEGHLASFLETGEIEISQLINEEKLPVIMRTINEMPEATIYSIKDKLGANYSFGELRTVVAYRRIKEKIPG